MADFRKISVLAALVVLLGMTSIASAQVTPPFQCNATAAVPPLLRAEGITELTGDIVLTCTGTGSAGLANFSVFLNTNITSRIYNSNGLSEALLMIDDPVATAIVPGANLFYGFVTGNQVTFLGVPVNPPGSTGTRIFRITNVRANATGISSGANNIPGSIQALISVSGSTSVPVNNPSQTVGFVQNGMAFTLHTGGSLTSTPNSNTDISQAQCNSVSRTNSSAQYIVGFAEGFPTSFKPQASTGEQNVPGQIYNTESGFYAVQVTPPTSGSAGGGTGTQPGLANQPTMVKMIVTDVPNGVNVYASSFIYFQNPSGSWRKVGTLVTGETGAIGPFPPANTDFNAPSPMSSAADIKTAGQIPVSANTAVAIYRLDMLLPGDALTLDTAFAWVKFNYSANVANNTPATGTASIAGAFAPTSTVVTASQTEAIPRFGNILSPTSPTKVLTIFACKTNLLYPFVTNQAGFDTGLAISNTSLDTGVFARNTTPQSGSCTVFPFGDNAGASFSTGNIAGGKTWVTVASAQTSLQNFQGYVIASCPFQFAHGFAFISDFRAQQLAMGYLALIIPEPGQSTRNALTPSTGEALSQ